MVSKETECRESCSPEVGSEREPDGLSGSCWGCDTGCLENQEWKGRRLRGSFGPETPCKCRDTGKPVGESLTVVGVGTSDYEGSPGCGGLIMMNVSLHIECRCDDSHVSYTALHYCGALYTFVVLKPSQCINST